MDAAPPQAGVPAVAPPLRAVSLRPGIIDRYLLGLMLRPMAIALGVTMVALLSERLLRLVDLIADHDAALWPVLVMTLGLTPHYLGLALPAAFCIGLLSTLGNLSRYNELDALEAAGWSLRRIGAAFVVSGVILSTLSLLLFGFAQPYARYAYRAAKHAIAEAGWSGRIEQGVFFDVGDGIVLSAGEVDATGRVLRDVFVLVRDEDGETATTAARGIVLPDPAAGVVRLRLEDGVTMGERATLRFDTLLLSREFRLDANPFRPRGDLRELTLTELAGRAAGAGGLPPDPQRTAELHARIVRSVSLIGIALAAVPLGVVGKRRPSWPRMVLALGLLTAYHHILLFVQELGALGRIDPRLGLWGVWAGFMALSFWLYVGTAGQGGRPPARKLLRVFDYVPVPGRTGAP